MHGEGAVSRIRRTPNNLPKNHPRGQALKITCILSK
jgi:hypothetical protein